MSCLLVLLEAMPPEKHVLKEVSDLPSSQFSKPLKSRKMYVTKSIAELNHGWQRFLLVALFRIYGPRKIKENSIDGVDGLCYETEAVTFQK